MNRLKTVFTFLFPVTCLFSCRHDRLIGDPPELLPPILTAHYEEINENIAGYYSGVPASYESHTDKRYPTIICFVGAGGYGNGGEELKKIQYGITGFIGGRSFPPSFQVDNTSFSFLFLAPQFRRFATVEEIRSFVDFVIANYRVDRSRLYLVGTSLGGRMASDYCASYPTEVAAVITMGGCSGDDALYSLNDKCFNISSANLPVWSFHNRYDKAWPVGDSEKFIAKLKSFNSKVTPKLTIFDQSEGEANHDCWTRAANPFNKFEGVNIYEWLLKYKR